MRCVKHRHASRGKAMAQMKSLVEVKGAEPDELHTYYCGKCRAWHVGHLKREEIERRRKGMRA